MGNVSTQAMFRINHAKEIPGNAFFGNKIALINKTSSKNFDKNQPGRHKSFNLRFYFKIKVV